MFNKIFQVISRLIIFGSFIFAGFICHDNGPQELEEYDVKVYFNQTVFQPANQANLEQVVIDFINQATTNIDLAVYDFDLASIAQALVNKHQKGVQVRFITDNDNIGPDNQAVLTLLSSANIPWIDDRADGSAGSGIQHNKFVVVDNRYVLTGSTNFTQSGIHGDLDNSGNLKNDGNTNHVITIESTQLANIYTQQFNEMWGDGPGGATDSKFGLPKTDHTLQTVYTDNDNIRIDVLFTPKSSTQYDGSALDVLADYLGGAQNRIYIAQFVFSAQVLADTMEVRHDAGVEVKGIGDRGFLYRYYSEFLDLAGRETPKDDGSFEVDNTTGHSNNPWANPAEVKVATVKEDDKFHHKYWVIDTIAVTGSMNASAAGAFTNDENIIFIHDKKIAEQFVGEFNKRFSEATPLN